MATKIWGSVLRLAAKIGGETGAAIEHDLSEHKAEFDRRGNLLKEKKENAKEIRKYRLPL